MSEFPTDPEIDEQLADRIAALDDAVRGGSSLDAGITWPSLDEHHLDDVEYCLRLLNRAWPKGDTSEPAPLTIGRFVIERELGQGGFGTVFLARDPKLHRLVALKIARRDKRFSQETRGVLEREAKAAASLDHPNIVSIYEAGDAGPFFYIASAYCPGPNLAAWLRSRAALPSAEQAAAMVALLAGAVAYAHEHGIVHRDIKPSNIMLMPREDTAEDESEPRFEPRLTDFGLAKLLDSDLQDTRSSRMMGTPLYMAPEQMSRASRVGPLADVYALGAILFEMLTGEPPLNGETFIEVMDRVRHHPAPLASRSRPDLPPELDAICAKCLEKEPAHRYSSALELSEDLLRFTRGEIVAARPLRAWQRALRFCQHPHRMRDAGVYAMGFNAVMALWLLVVALTMGTGISPTPPDVALATMKQCLIAVGVLIVPTGLLGYSAWRRWRWAIWVGAVVTTFHLGHAISGLFGGSGIFEELYSRSPEFRQMQFVLLTIGMGIQAGLFILAAVADRAAQLRRQ